MNAIPSEFSKILTRVQILSQGPKKFEEVLNPKYEDDIQNFNILALNPQWESVAQSTVKQVKNCIAEIRSKRETIFESITEYLKVTVTKNNPLGYIDDIEPEIDLDFVEVTDDIRRVWLAKVEIELAAYEFSLLNINPLNKIIRTGSFRLKSTVIDAQLSELYDLNVSNKKGNEEFIDPNYSGNKSDFIKVFKSPDFSKTEIDVVFKFGCDNVYAAFIFHWLNTKNIITGSWKTVENSGYFISKTSTDNSSITSGALRTALISKSSRSKIDSTIVKKPSFKNLGNMNEDAPAEQIFEYLHGELYSIFLSIPK